METDKLFQTSLKQHIATFSKLQEIHRPIEKSAAILIEALKQNNTIFTCGNGGSASDAQHLTAELVGRFERERKALASVCLNTDTSVLTAIANDYGYENVFSRQLQGVGCKSDILIAITTSGSSPNIQAAVLTALENQMSVIILTSQKATWPELVNHPDICLLKVPSSITASIQEAHIFIIHFLCRVIDQEFCQ